MKNISFWEKNWLTDYDYVVIGAGIVGCFTALKIASENNKRFVEIRSPVGVNVFIHDKNQNKIHAELAQSIRFNGEFCIKLYQRNKGLNLKAIIHETDDRYNEI